MFSVHNALLVVFIIAIILPVYSYLIYPIILYLIGLMRKPMPYSDTDEDLHENYSFPSVAVVIAAYNEEECIESRVNNLLALDYPLDKLNIYIGSDGSDDKTNDILNNFTNPIVKIYPFDKRRGKATVLNELMDQVEEEIIVFSDANTDFKLDALKIITNDFYMSNVGGVCGELQILSKENNDNLDSMYWRYERLIKRGEGKIDAILGANGAIYAIRKELFEPIPADTITDDFYIGMSIVSKGFSFLYQPKAIAYEYEPDSHSQEFGRRIRIGTGNYQAFFRLLKFLNPFAYGRYTFTYISHKVIRWFTPHLMLVLLIASGLLASNKLFFVLFISQIVLYLFSYIAYKKLEIKKLPVILSLGVFFVSMNAALLIGSYKYITQKSNPIWQRTAR